MAVEEIKKTGMSGYDLILRENRNTSVPKNFSNMAVDFAGTVGKTTIQGYIRDILEFFGEENIQNISLDIIRMVNGEVARKWRDRLLENGLSQNTINKKLASLSSLYSYLSSPEIQIYSGVSYNPFEQKICRRFRTNSVPKRALSMEEEKIILESIDESSINGMRNKLLILLLSTTGIRRNEVRNVSTSDFFIDRGRLILRVCVKRQKYLDVEIQPGVQQLLNKYLKARNISLSDTKEYLFVDLIHKTGNKKPLSNKTIWKIIKDITRMAGIADPDTVTVHSFRHGYITYQIAAGAKLEVVQKRVGHENIKTTQLYNHMNYTHNNPEAKMLDGYLTQVGS